MIPARRVKYRLCPVGMKKPRFCDDAIEELLSSSFFYAGKLKSRLYSPQQGPVCIIKLPTPDLETLISLIYLSAKHRCTERYIPDLN